MSTEYWNIHNDFEKTPSRELVSRFWIDDELNRQRSETTFKDQAMLVDEGLKFFMEALQGAMRGRAEWSRDVRLRAAIAMLIHALNSYLAWRHLLSLGYLSEARLFSRSTHEAMTQALVFANDDRLAQKFYDGRQISPRDIRKNLSSLVSNESVGSQDTYSLLSNHYQRLAVGAHPTLNSFMLRTFSEEMGNIGLQKAVPERVVIGGFLQDDFGRVSWLGLAQNIGISLASVGKILMESSGNWDKQTEEYRAKIAKMIKDDDIRLDEQLAE